MPTPLSSCTCSFMAWNSLMTAAAISCPLSVDWASITVLTEKRGGGGAQLRGRLAVEMVRTATRRHDGTLDCLRGWATVYYHNRPGKVVAYAVSAVFGRFQRRSGLPDHNLECDPATPQPGFFQTLLYLHGQVGQETLGLVHLVESEDESVGRPTGEGGRQTENKELRPA